MADKNLSIKLSVTDADLVKRTLEAIGKDGQAALKAIEAGSAPASRGLLRLDDASRRLQSSLKGALDRATSFRAVIGAVAGTSGLGLLVRNALGAADALQDTADKFGANTEKLQELYFAANQTGAGVESLNQGLTIFADNIANAAKGTGPAVDAFNKLQIPLKDVKGNLRPITDLLLDVADAINKVADPAERVSLARDFFGKGGGDLLVMLQQGSEGLERMAKQARELGLVLDAALVKRAADASDQLDALGASFKANFSIGLIEGFSGAFGTIGDLLKDPEFQRSIREFGETVGELLRWVVENASTLITVFTTIKGALIGGTAGAVLGPWGALGGAVVGGGAGLVTGTELTGTTNFFGLHDRPPTEQELRARLEKIEGELASPVRGGRFNRGSDLPALKEEQAAITAVLDQVEAAQRAAAQAAGRGGSAGAGSGVEVDPSSVPVKLASATKEAKSALDDYLVSLRQQLELTGMTATEQERAEAVMRGQEAAQRDYDNKLRDSPILSGEEVAAIERSVTARQELVAVTNDAAAVDAIWLDMQKQAQVIIEGLGGAAAKLARELREIRTLREAGLLSPGQADQAGRELEQSYSDQADALEDLKAAGQDFASVIGTAFEDATLRGGELSDVIAGLEEDMLRIAQRVLVTKPFENWLTGLLGGGSSGGGGGGDLNSSINDMLGSNPDLFGSSVSSQFSGGGGGGTDLLTQIFGNGGWIGNLFGFAEGGDFTVGGSGGTDSQVRALRLTPGEEVSVRRPDQVDDGDRRNIINATINLPPAPNAFGYSPAQMARRTAAELQRTAARLG